ncbi:MarR family winged helix-turn-helix transcriptional regulator [Skermania piniformis]|uniref:MarR family transcriptional regulator n=1 Tax=Skermania pinensis TaxID=39122 RepID=A0ABX8SCL1_9ACTN|nr:MarR family transcriptional regulator [Skermania piniformis]QXQ15640.1 MarR family transcriptional regulator [Skermania piniformis]
MEESLPRAEVERLIAADIRALTGAADQLSQSFSSLHGLRPNDFRALLHVFLAESRGLPLTAGRLGVAMGMSASAITYLVERMVGAGHLLRQADVLDRRKVVLRYGERGMAVAQDFFAPLGRRTNAALSGVSDEDLATTHRVLELLVAAMREHVAELPQPG